MNIKLLLESIKAARGAGTFGDAALLKLAALGSPDDDVAKELENVRGYAPRVEMRELESLPEGTLGHAYAEFLKTHEIELLQFSPELLERFEDRPFSVRYTATHDLHHVITGFDAGIAGEAGVFAFTVGQGTAPNGKLLLKAFRYLYPLLSPSNAQQIRHNVALGLELGRRAKLLIACPLEDFFDLPLVEVRHRLGVPDPQDSRPMSSEPSWLANALYSSVFKPEANELDEAITVEIDLDSQAA